jgi:hypothetical protein
MIKRLTIFVLGAILLLPIGYNSAQWVWFRFHHRYDSPETGLYHGYVSAAFDSFDEPFYFLSFHGETSPRWYWRQPTNFSYTALEVEWRDEAGDQRATVSLPAFTYHFGEASGAFTRDVLASWLFGSTNRISDTRHVDAIFGYFEAAARGALPPPRHHSYYLEQPVQVRATHFLLGYGVGSTVYIWLPLWLLLVVLIGQKILKRHDA